MENDEKKIPWDPIEARLKELKRKAPWLADELGVDKNAVYNWPKRGGVPMAHLPKLVQSLGVSADKLLESANVKSGNRDQKRALSDEARALIQCVIRLDMGNDHIKKIFRLHAGLLLLSQNASPPQDLSAEQNLLDLAELEAQSFRDQLSGGDDAGIKERRS